MIGCGIFATYVTPIVSGVAIAFLILQNLRLWRRAYLAECQIRHTPPEVD